MTECHVCGTQDLTRSCQYCGKTVCTDHTLPEKHSCPALKIDDPETKHFESSFPDQNNEAGSQNYPTTGSNAPSSPSEQINRCDKCGSQVASASADLCLDCRRDRANESDKSDQRQRQDQLESTDSDTDNELTGVCDACGDPAPEDADYCISCRRKGLTVDPQGGDNSPPVVTTNHDKEELSEGTKSDSGLFQFRYIVYMIVGLLIIFSLIQIL